MGSPREEMRQVVLQELRRLGIGTRRGPIQSLEMSGATPYATVQGYQGGTTDEQLRAVLLEPFGHASRPPAETNALLVRHGGQWVAVAVDDRTYRPDLSAGEVALYDQAGNLVHLKEDHTIELNEGTDAVAAEGDTVTVSFALTAPAGGGDVTGTITAEIAATGRSVKV